MENKIRVDVAANKLKASKNKNYLSSTFKSLILKRFRQIQYGHIELVDDNKVYSFGNPDSESTVKVEVLSQDFYVLLGSGGIMGAAEAYTAGCWKADDLVVLLRTVFRNKNVISQLDSGWAKLARPLNKFVHWLRKNSLSGSKENILAHYDLSNEFYQLWLDETMTYSCGYFKDEHSSMKDASVEKLDRICRKLNIQPEDSVLEIGTGWGSFAMHAVKNYGCKVTTTTISDAQYELAKARFQQAGLEDKITLLKDDYRNLTGQFDKIVSIEMIEAVGHQFVPTYLQKVASLLKNDGLFAMQGITYNDQNFDRYKGSVDFIKKYIFPGSCLISISQMTEAMKKYTDLSLSHLEDITYHYAITLKRWRTKFLEELDATRKLGFTDEFINMWEFYFVYCEAGFRERNIGDYQFVFSKPNSQNIKVEY